MGFRRHSLIASSVGFKSAVFQTMHSVKLLDEARIGSRYDNDAVFCSSIDTLGLS